jgi:hypothetical protein
MRVAAGTDPASGEPDGRRRKKRTGRPAPQKENRTAGAVREGVPTVPGQNTGHQCPETRVEPDRL